MKSTIIAVLFLCSAAVASAQTPGDKVSGLLTQLSAVSQQIGTLDKTEGKWVTDRETNLISTKELLDGAVKNANLGTAALGEKIQAFVAEKNQHDNQVRQFEPLAAQYSAACSGTGDQAYVNNCNAWKARLEPTRASLDAWKGRLDNTQATLTQESTSNDAYVKGLNERVAQLSQDTLDWAARKKAYLANRDDLGAKFNQIREQLRRLADQYNTCTTEFINDPKNSDELIKHKCGNIQFDGAPVTLDQLRSIAPAWRMQ